MIHFDRAVGAAAAHFDVLLLTQLGLLLALKLADLLFALGLHGLVDPHGLYLFRGVFLFLLLFLGQFLALALFYPLNNLEYCQRGQNGQDHAEGSDDLLLLVALLAEVVALLVVGHYLAVHGDGLAGVGAELSGS